MENTAIQKNENQVSIPERIDQGQYYTPRVDIAETNDAFIFQADLPGVKAGDVDISYENGVLTIQGRVPQRQSENHNYIWREYGVGHFQRQFTISTPINVDAIKAEMKNGVLELNVPKAESAKTRKIEIKTS